MAARCGLEPGRGGAGRLFTRLLTHVKALGEGGFRAVLWHQGENDAAVGTSTSTYQTSLTRLIRDLRADAGFPVRWGIAEVGFYRNGDAARFAAVVAGQRAVAAAVDGAFLGPATDPVVGPDYRHDGIHFNTTGLAVHARGWHDRLVPLLRGTPGGLASSPQPRRFTDNFIQHCRAPYFNGCAPYHETTGFTDAASTVSAVFTADRYAGGSYNAIPIRVRMRLVTVKGGVREEGPWSAWSEPVAGLASSRSIVLGTVAKSTSLTVQLDIDAGTAMAAYAGTVAVEVGPN